MLFPNSILLGHSCISSSLYVFYLVHAPTHGINVVSHGHGAITIAAVFSYISELIYHGVVIQYFTECSCVI